MRIKLPLTEYVSYSFEELLDMELKRAYRGGQSFSLALVAFSTGTSAGRAVRILQDTLRDTDTVIRHGETSFLVFMPMTNKEGARFVIERLQHAFASEDYLDDAAGNTTFRVSYITFPEDGDNKEQLLELLLNNL
ncbi:diguanylate cyclase domain-containing protein [Dethiobacter alkaliphilus]|uniref:diguanylate cyclase domain-containing protein n=1 Tax=Dethiobacter alkaliphilus TaxID=427926 RepID=UPI0022272D9D|nr:diguanylate cyclase [Dethiobacter alkaliphilus]MCW3489672.1 diguanylate cyclase [Dethiobacter alkaliphilus]